MSWIDRLIEWFINHWIYWFVLVIGIAIGMIIKR